MVHSPGFPCRLSVIPPPGFTSASSEPSEVYFCFFAIRLTSVPLSDCLPGEAPEKNEAMPSLHIIQHVPFEPAGILPDLARRRGWPVSVTEQFSGDMLPPVESIDRLIVMGGPMGTKDEAEFPYLTAEKAFIKSAIDRNVPVLGICLGAQLLAETLGATVRPNGQKEIGFFPVQKTDAAGRSRFFADFPDTFTPLHWHGDTFRLPDGATQIARTDVCEQQAFEFGPHIGLQFHLEMTPELLTGLIENARHELVAAPFIMSEAELKEKVGLLYDAHALMVRLFERWLE